MIDYVYVLNLIVAGKAEHLVSRLDPDQASLMRVRLTALLISGAIDHFSLDLVPLAGLEHVERVVRELEDLQISPSGRGT